MEFPYNETCHFIRKPLCKYYVNFVIFMIFLVESPTSTEYNFGLQKSIDLGVFSEEALMRLLYGENTMKHVQSTTRI